MSNQFANSFSLNYLEGISTAIFISWHITSINKPIDEFYSLEHLNNMSI